MTVVPLLHVQQEENMPHVSSVLHGPASSASMYDLLRSPMSQLTACLMFTKKGRFRGLHVGGRFCHPQPFFNPFISSHLVSGRFMCEMNFQISVQSLGESLP